MNSFKKKGRVLIAMAIALSIGLSGCRGDNMDPKTCTNNLDKVKVVNYVGNASEVKSLLDTIGFSQVGDYTIELKTKERPYGLILRFQTVDADCTDEKVKNMEILVLGLIENLDYIEIYGGNEKHALSKEEASGALGYDVKMLSKNKVRLEEFIKNNIR